MPKLKQFLREQVIFLTVAFISFSAQPAIVWAQEINPLPFTEPLNASRGSVTPTLNNATYLTDGDICTVTIQIWGWSSCNEVDTMILGQFPGVDTTLILKPDSSGFVAFDDWEGDEKNAVIADIEDSERQGMAAQGQALGIDIRFAGWSVYPTLNHEKQMMYYATDAIWDGEKSINITATVFDRRGYVEFLIIPSATQITPEETEAMITKVLSRYEPAQGQEYTAFAEGDKVAAVGAVGVLAALAGVQYGKGPLAALMATALLILKKAWFVLLLPFIWLKGLFSRNKGS
ncbi:DUF2167 domain-containing protein [Yoonia sp. R2-816]|uniref:DUF2167 domain-containing protein n=1 Tax=Yoonia sp. R2-816 TaxID=3342638 RepID=UPI00372C8E0B